MLQPRIVPIARFYLGGPLLKPGDSSHMIPLSQLPQAMEGGGDNLQLRPNCLSVYLFTCLFFGRGWAARYRYTSRIRPFEGRFGSCPVCCSFSPPRAARIPANSSSCCRVYGWYFPDASYCRIGGMEPSFLHYGTCTRVAELKSPTPT